LDAQAMAKRMAQLQEHGRKQEDENARLLLQLSKLQKAQEELEGSYRKLDEENARLSAQLLDGSSKVVFLLAQSCWLLKLCDCLHT